MAQSMDPENFVPIRQGRNYPNLAPAGSFRGPQGWIVLLCTEWQMPNLWSAIGRPDLAEDARFDTNPNRLTNRQALTDIIESWMATFETDAEVMSGT